jgi:ABC-type proline/glycine betaine transport system ATPase subunit
MNTQLLNLINKMFKAVLVYDINEAIRLNDEITKILDTYKDAC